MNKPLADRLRPQTLTDVVGQRHLLSEGMPVFAVLERSKQAGMNLPNMIFYGPSGTGKTTVANLIAKNINKKLYKLNATNASVADIKSIIADLDGFEAQNGVVLYLDEIQNFNKKQQQSLLEYVEKGDITLIASTTENPYFYIYNALLSRCTVFEFKELSDEDIKGAVTRAVSILQEDMAITFSDEAVSHIATTSGGDCRKALNTVEMCSMIAKMDKDGTIAVTLEDVERATSKKAFRYDKDGDSHYDVLSALQKSIRGSDPDAALHYLARLIAGGDLISICRRIQVMASEDIGLAYPQAVSIVKSCVDAAFQLGFPEARLPLAQAVILLATAPKSNSVIMSIDAALSDVEHSHTGDIPAHLKDGHYAGAKKLGHAQGYQYPHNFPNHYVPQQYLPDEIMDKSYYFPCDNKFENEIQNYAKKIDALWSKKKR
ncbi:MAG: replication-associated recombination protein A [Clostridia bacterium]|nr:replication-associated recombination protein A [Clostridia bacterium]